MKLIFLGVGEAVDENYGNTSILIEGDINVLLDCGFTVPHALGNTIPARIFLMLST